MADVLVERVGAQRLLHRDEAGAGIALVRDEEQTGVELIGDRIDPVGERVAAPQEPDAVVLPGCGEPDVAVERDHRLAVDLGGEVHGVVLPRRAQRRTAALDPPDGELLVGQGGAVPHLEQHADPPGHQVAAAAHPRGVVGRRHPDVLLQLLGVLGHEVVGAVLEPHEVARGLLRGVGARRAPEAGLGPAQRDHAASDAREVADRVEAHRAGRRRTPAPRGRRRSAHASSSSPANVGMGTSAAGFRATMPNGSPERSNSDAPKPNVTVKDDGPRSSASPVSSGGASWSELSVPTGRPAVMRRAARVHSCRSPTSSSRSSVSTSNDANSNRAWAGVTIPAWWVP